MQGDFVRATTDVTAKAAQPKSVVAAEATAPTSVVSAPIVNEVSSRGHMPIVFTVIGILVFVGGVSGLFIYALSGM